MFFEKLADFIIRRAKLIIAIWLIVLLISVPLMAQSGSVLQYDMTKMSSSTQMESQKGMEMLNSGEFNSSSAINGGTIIVVEILDSQYLTASKKLTSNLEDAFYFWNVNKELREKYGREYQITVTETIAIDDKYFKDKDTIMLPYTVTYPTLPDGTALKGSNYIAPIRELVADAKEGVDGITGTYVTGNDAISYDTMTGAVSDIKKIDPISILLILVLIGLFFRSFISAATPPIIIGMAYGILLAFVFVIGNVIGIFYITTILVLVSMLGAGCDYGIFIISRYREERKECKPHKEALRESIIWAGESIITSGISVIIGFGSLVLCSFSLVSNMGIVLAMGILLALLAALTFVPALLALIGDKVFWPSNVETYMEGSKAMNGWYGKCGSFGLRYFTHSAKTSIKYAKVIVVAVILLTVPLGYVALTSSPSYDMISAMPPGEAKEGVSIISQNVGGGIIMPTTITMKVDAFVDVSDSTLTSGSVVQMNSTVRYTAQPNEGYEVSGWFVDGTWIASSDTTYDLDTSLTPTMSSHDVEVVFILSEYDIVYSVDGSHGSLFATANDREVISGQSASYGNKLKFTADPDAGYHVSKWTISRDGVSETIHTNDTVIEIDTCSYNYDVKVTFVQDSDTKYTVKYSVEGGSGELSVRADDKKIDSGASIQKGSYMTMYLMPDKGYETEALYINGAKVTLPLDKSSYTYESLDKDLNIVLKVKETVTPTYTVTFTNAGEGTVTATVNGANITSGTAVTAGSNVVITATPKDGKVVEKWTFNYFAPSIFKFDIYTDKTEHRITSIENNVAITVTFSEKVDTQYAINYVQPANGSLTAMVGGEQIMSGDKFYSGSNLFFSVNPESGYCVSDWLVNGVGGSYGTNNTLSLNMVHENITVEPVLVAIDNVLITYKSNNDSYGKLTAKDADPSSTYAERSNASEVYQSLDAFSQSLMNLQTDGKNNIAMAIGPITGDILFDGNHQKIYDTIISILPESFRSLLGNFNTYDMAVHIWKDALSFEMKQNINYLLTYKTGFVSAPFSEIEGGKEYQYVKFLVMTSDEPMSALSVNTIKQLYTEKDTFISENSASKDGFAYCGYLSGAAVSNYEISELVGHDFKFIIIVVIVLLIILLFVVMRSYLTPIRAVFTIVMSVIWTLGLTYLLFEQILHMPVVWIVPIVLFVVCLGLGMDYDILLTTRIKECVSKGMSNDDAITAAVQKSGAVITLCGLIMAGAFGTMMLSTSPMLKEFGFALGFAIAVDALIIRTYVVPAIMHLMGKWNWKGPSFSLKERREKRKAKRELEEQ